MKILYVGFFGKAGAGKTTACNMLKDIHKPKPCLILPWAGELKRIARDEFGWDGKKDDKGRKLLQVLGTECGRMYGGDQFWVNKWQEKVNKFVDPYRTMVSPPILILNDDTRFDSEAQRIREKGGAVIEIFGREIDLGVNSSHSSESGINTNYIDYRIDNSGSMEELKQNLFDLYREWRL